MHYRDQVLTALLDRQVMAESYGRRPAAVIALHGWGRSSSDWRPVLGGLDALAVDLPGFGASPEPGAALSVAEYATRLVPLAVESAPVVLVGHSFGGRVALRLAAQRPDLVRGVVLTGAPVTSVEGPRRPPAFAFRAVRALRRLGLVSEGRLEAARRRYGSDDYRNATAVMRGVLVRAVGEDYSDALDAVRAAGVPFRLVWGADDPVVPLAVGEKAAALIGPTAELEAVPGSAHLLDAALSRRIRVAIDGLLDARAEA